MNDNLLIEKYFPSLTIEQKIKFDKLYTVYDKWNNQINVISRKDMDHFYERHVLHSLSIAKIINFEPDTTLIDIGTGGGFPGIPLAILFPQCSFTLVDSIGKKIKVVKEVCEELGINNVIALHSRAEQINEQFDFIISRAVTSMPIFLTWVKNKLKNENKNELENGILYLKGGDLKEEMKTVKKHIRYYKITDFFDESFFETKKIVYIH
jgi:16S rRNA (guanine527-N7)-methyltransferase